MNMRTMENMGTGKNTSGGSGLAHYHATDINDKLVINLRELGHVLRFITEGKGSQSRILIILAEEGETTQQRLTGRLHIQPGSAVKCWQNWSMPD